MKKLLLFVLSISLIGCLDYKDPNPYSFLKEQGYTYISLEGEYYSCPGDGVGLGNKFQAISPITNKAVKGILCYYRETGHIVYLY